MKILIVDDEPHIVELLKVNLEARDNHVSFSYDGKEAYQKACIELFDVILLDVMLPNMTGIQVLSELKKDSINKDTPIIMLSAKSEVDDIILGLDCGADDYIAKPFSVQEVLARVKSATRKATRNTQNNLNESGSIAFSNVEIDESGRKVKIDNERVEFTKKEFDLLLCLYENKGRVLEREVLLEKIWGYDYEGETRTVDVHVKNIRKKLKLNDNDEYKIKTVVGVGYVFVLGDE